MRRTFGLDVLACPRCDGQLRLVALIEQASVVQRILRHLGLPTEVPEARQRGGHPQTRDDRRSVPVRSRIRHRLLRPRRRATIHCTLRVSPAMAAGVTNRLLDVSDLVVLLIESESKKAA
jgi:hypothetical protein